MNKHILEIQASFVFFVRRCLLVLLSLVAVHASHAQLSSYPVTINGGSNTYGTLNYAAAHLAQWVYTGVNGSIVLNPDTSLYDASLNAYVIKIYEPLAPITLFNVNVYAHSSKKKPVIIDFNGYEGFVFCRAANAINGPYKLNTPRRPGLILRNFKNFAVKIASASAEVNDVAIWTSQGSNGIECTNSMATIRRTLITVDSLASQFDQFGGTGILSSNMDHGPASTYEIFGATSAPVTSNGDFMHPGNSLSYSCSVDSSYIGFSLATQNTASLARGVDHTGAGYFKITNSVVAQAREFAMAARYSNRVDIISNRIGVYYSRSLKISNPSFPESYLPDGASASTGLLLGADNGQVNILGNSLGGFDKAIHLTYAYCGETRNGTRIGPGIGGSAIPAQSANLTGGLYTIANNVIGADKANSSGWWTCCTQ